MRRKKREVFNPHEISFNIVDGRRPGMVFKFFLSVDNEYCTFFSDCKICMNIVMAFCSEATIGTDK